MSINSSRGGYSTNRGLVQSDESPGSDDSTHTSLTIHHRTSSLNTIDIHLQTILTTIDGIFPHLLRLSWWQFEQRAISGFYALHLPFPSPVKTVKRFRIALNLISSGQRCERSPKRAWPQKLFSIISAEILVSNTVEIWVLSFLPIATFGGRSNNTYWTKL